MITLEPGRARCFAATAVAAAVRSLVHLRREEWSSAAEDPRLDVEAASGRFHAERSRRRDLAGPMLTKGLLHGGEAVVWVEQTLDVTPREDEDLGHGASSAPTSATGVVSTGMRQFPARII